MKNFFIKLSAQISIISLLFCVIIASFMFSDFLRFNKLEAPAESSLENLRSKITASPENEELKSLFLDLELVYRRAYFVNDKQQEKGCALLLFGVSAFLLSFAFRAYLLQTLPKLPEKDSLKKEEKLEDTFIKILLSSVAVASVISVGFVVMQNSGQEVVAPIEKAYSSQAELNENWTSFRGSRNDGIAKNASLPENIKISELWQSPIDIEGFNSVVHFGDTIYISGDRDSARVVKAFSVDTGEELWEKSLDKNVETNYDDQTGAAPSTMSCDAYRAYAIFPSGELVSYSKEGNLVWQKNFPLPEINYGYASSLLLCENAIIVQMSLDESNIIYALDAATGKELWQAISDVHSPSWSTPTIVEFNSKKIIIALTSAEVMAIDFDSGEFLWKNKCMGGEVAPSASYGNGKVYVANENVAAFALDISTGEILWENSSVVLPSISSISVDEDVIYIYSSGATITKLNANDGEVISELDVDEGFNSSPILIGNKVLACDLSGKIFITKKGEDIADSLYDLEEAINATPAIVGNKIILRLESKILCLKLEEAK